MAKKRRKRKAEVADSAHAVPELTGVARLLSELPADRLDLHGMTAPDAERRIRDFVRTQSRLNAGRVVHIVTGRGTRSQGAPVLPGLTRELLSGELAAYVVETGGLPGGGAVAVRLR